MKKLNIKLFLESGKNRLKKTKSLLSKSLSNDKLKPSILIESGKNNLIKTKNLLKEISNNDQFNPSILIQKLQDKVEKIAPEDNNQVFLKQPRFWAISLNWALISTASFAVGWLAIAETDEIVIATGKLEPKGGVFEVQMPVEGVASEILIKEGQIVKKGQVLIRLDTEITKAKNLALMNSLELNELIKKKLETLVAEGAVSELQYLEQKEKIEELKSRIKANEVRLKYQEIIAPVGGKVFALQPKGVGFVAQTSQPILKIVPSDNLIAKIEIPSRTIGFVKTGKKADISIDSFPATDFGVIEGTITRIGSDSLLPNPAQGMGFRFPADITLDKQYLQIKSGRKLSLQPGMSLTANIKLRKATFLQILFNKFTDKANSLKSI